MKSFIKITILIAKYGKIIGVAIRSLEFFIEECKREGIITDES